MLMELYYNVDVIEIGLDEAGRGPLLGNVYASAVIWPKDLIPPKGVIKDSKKLSSAKRKISLEWIKNNIEHYSIGFATNIEIDEINILEATKLAMQRAIDKLNIKTDYLLIDGTNWENKFLNYKVKSIVKGDNKYYSIAAASILAKESHDEHILELCKNDVSLINNYSLNTNMGYGTKNHIDGIKKYGYTIYHRKSFNIKK
jgi:ribonuclease HII